MSTQTCVDCRVGHEGVTPLLCPLHQSAQALLDALEGCIEAFRLTREYVGAETLPNIKGWSHYDAVVAARVALAQATRETDDRGDY